jgi:hypothetical protein
MTTLVFDGQVGASGEATTRRIVERLADERPAATDADAIVRPYDGVDEAMAVVVGVSQLLADLGVDAVYTTSYGTGPAGQDASRNVLRAIIGRT